MGARTRLAPRRLQFQYVRVHWHFHRATNRLYRQPQRRKRPDLALSFATRLTYALARELESLMLTGGMNPVNLADCMGAGGNRVMAHMAPSRRPNEVCKACARRRVSIPPQLDIHREDRGCRYDTDQPR